MTIRTTFPTAFGTVSIGDGLPTYLIAEIGLNHNGSEELAQEMIRQAAISGASFVKFQKRSPPDLATAAFLDAPFEKCPVLGNTQREVRERLELPLEVYQRLRVYAESLGLVFFASAFDLPSLDFLLSSGVKVIKLASHSLTNGPLLERIADLKLPTILSLGGSTSAEQDRAVDVLKNCPLVLLHCVSSYPTPDGMAKIDTISYLKDRYRLPVGYSSHETGIDLSVAAATLGACMIERHFSLNRAMIGLDQPISLEPAEFAEMALRIRRVFGARGVAESLQEGENTAKNAYHVAVRASRAIKKGETVTAEMLVCKQPLSDRGKYFTGFEMHELVGKSLTVNVAEDEAIPRNAVI